MSRSQFAVDNPVGELKELSDFVRIPVIKRFEEQGLAHSKRYTCFMTFAGRQFVSSMATHHKEAERSAAAQLLNALPIHKLEDSCIRQRGGAHELMFQAVVDIDDMSVESEWHKKKVDAKRDAMQLVISRFLSLTEDMPSSSSNSAPPTPPITNDTVLRVGVHLRKWQDVNIRTIYEKLRLNQSGLLEDPKKEAELRGLITVAFIHSSFSHSDELKKGVMDFLKTKYSSYERLEFFGDSILGFLASKILFEKNDSDTPHELTMKRQIMVREDACCAYMRKLELDDCVIHRDILQTPSPKVLCDVFEAIIGALYIVFKEKSFNVIMDLIDSKPPPTQIPTRTPDVFYPPLPTSTPSTSQYDISKLVYDIGRMRFGDPSLTSQ